MESTKYAGKWAKKFWVKIGNCEGNNMAKGGFCVGMETIRAAICFVMSMINGPATGPGHSRPARVHYRQRGNVSVWINRNGSGHLLHDVIHILVKPLAIVS